MSVMLHGFERSDCARAVDARLTEWTCRSCQAVNPIECGEPREQACSECGALKTFGREDHNSTRSRDNETLKRWRVRG